jgi:hypothetical protein
MPTLYSYRCDSCKRLFSTEHRGDSTTCPGCKRPAVRNWSFTTSSSLKEHYNNAVGQYVSNRHEMSEALKRQGDEMSARTGLHHEYEMVDPGDMADPSAHGVSEDGLEESRKRHHDLFAQ